ncbi:MAG: glycosyltransferase [Sulfuricaulis sp.]|nr:glycosyltransferase [Sulfuricaulis sp.]
MNEFAVVIPAYNESSTIRDVVRRVLALSQHVIVVDDGSVDGTGEAIADLPIVLLRNEKNSGKAACLWRGMQHAMEKGVDAVITLDADGQHQPEDIPRFLEMAHRHPDHIIIGSRLADSGAFPRRRYYANKVANFWISWAAGYYIKDSQSGFRLYPKSLLNNKELVVNRVHGFVFESEILIEAVRRGVYSLNLPISAIYKSNARASHFRPVLDIVRITRMVAWRLISRGLYPWGLISAFFLPRRRVKPFAIGVDGMAMMLLTNIVILMTGGISLCLQWRKAYRIARQSPISVPASEYYVVLGKRLQNGLPTLDFAQRLTRAEKLHRQNPQGKILVMGGITSLEGIPEAQAGKTFLLARGVAEEDILVESASRHTLENLRQTRDMLGEADCCPIVFVTSRYHLARCHVLASGLGIAHYLCASEDEWCMTPRTFLHLMGEAYYLHWYFTGKMWSTLTANRKTLERIT